MAHTNQISRVVMPETARRAILKELHSCHFGIVKVKILARSAVWWPGIDRDIEKNGRTVLHLPSPQPEPSEGGAAPLAVPSEKLVQTSYRLHRTKEGKIFVLVVVDAHSK